MIAHCSLVRFFPTLPQRRRKNVHLLQIDRFILCYVHPSVLQLMDMSMGNVGFFLFSLSIHKIRLVHNLAFQTCSRPLVRDLTSAAISSGVMAAIFVRTSIRIMPNMFLPLPSPPSAQYRSFEVCSKIQVHHCCHQIKQTRSIFMCLSHSRWNFNVWIHTDQMFVSRLQKHLGQCRML